MSRRLLVVDDESGVRAALRQLLEFEGYEVRVASSGAEALATYEAWKPELVFMDVKMTGMDGLETLKRLRGRDPSAIVVMISGHATIQNAVEATQLGAYDILEKPLDTDRILVTLRNAIGRIELAQENQRLKATIESRYEIVGRSSTIRAVIEKIDELIARAIHRQSPRSAKRFVEVNCAAIPGELIESELFGHMKGSFTGAGADRAGKFEQADGGTLFLDEIGDMSLAAQAKVLRVLQDGEVTRIGGQKPTRVDVRVLAATNKTLEDEIAAGRFREDLYYRLNVVPIHVPALRERREDIPQLIVHFLQQFTTLDGAPSRGMEHAAAERLVHHGWPGNVRELRNTIERLLILSSGPSITASDAERLVGARTGASGGIGALEQCKTYEEFKDAAEKLFLQARLREHDWNVAETARAIDMPRSNLYNKIERHGLTRDHA
ncbi:MAG: sigma-54 dependent transcriptional regulator [Gemmatimonadetes bacterium]|nr:sigma-54 dependent transcriptional regulator [Gemmatimonadota bacterium]